MQPGGPEQGRRVRRSAADFAPHIPEEKMTGSREFSLEVLAEVTARIDAGESKEAVLAEFQVGAPQFADLQQRWLAQVGHQVLRGQFDQQRRYAAEYQTHLVKAQAKLQATSARAADEPPRPKPVFNKTMVGTPEMFAAAELGRVRPAAVEPRFDEPAFIPAPASPAAGAAPVPVPTAPVAAPPLVQQAAPPLVMAALAVGAPTPPPPASPLPPSPAPVMSASGTGASAGVTPQEGASAGRPRAFAKTSFASSGFSIFPQGGEPAPAAPSPLPAASPAALVPSPIPSNPPLAQPAFAQPAFAQPAFAQPVPASPAGVNPVGPTHWGASPPAPAPAMPAAPPAPAPAPPAFAVGRGAEPPMAPGYRNALGSLPPTPVRPAAGAAPAGAAPPAPAPFSPPAAAPSPPAPAPLSPGPFSPPGGPIAGPPPGTPLAAYPGGPVPPGAPSPALPPLNPSWERPMGGPAPLGGPAGGFGAPFGSPMPHAPAAGGFGAAPFGGQPGGFAGATPFGGAPGGGFPQPGGAPAGFGAGGMPQAPAVAAQSLSLEQIACIQAEIDLDPSRAAAVFSANGIASGDYERQFGQLQTVLATDEHKAQRFEQLRTYYRALVGPRR